MATTTTNFGWDIPQSTDLVKDGATAIAALGQDIDTALVDLKGGTTGQVLAKATNTDLDFTWVAQDDSNAIQNAIVDAKGDLITATANDTPARLGVGTNGHVLTADSAAATGIKWAALPASASGLTLITTASPSATGAVNFDNCFSSTYQSYQVHWNISGSTGSGLNIRLRVGGTNATTNYVYQFLGVSAGTVTASRDNSSQLFGIGAIRGTGRSYGIAHISNPFATAETSYLSSMQDPNSGGMMDFRCGSNTNATSYDGMSFYSDSGNFTGSIRIYGVQNS